MRIWRRIVCLLGVVLTLFLTACVSTKPTDTTVTTTLTSVDINTTTTYLPTLKGTTTTHTKENTTGGVTTSTTIPSQSKTTKLCYTYAQKYKNFTTIEDYRNFVKTVDEETLRSIFTKKNYDGSPYFDEKTFEIILQDRQYLLPVIPTGYTLKGIELATLDPMSVVLERDEEEYSLHCYMSRTEKRSDVEEDDSFFKQDGTKVTVDNLPSYAVNVGGGTCYWEEDGYQCFMRFTETNKEQVYDLVKAFELKVVSIE